MASVFYQFLTMFRIAIADLSSARAGVRGFIRIIFGKKQRGFSCVN
jgi:hypothetical protein